MTVTAALIAAIAEVDLQGGQPASANGGEPQCFGKG